MALISLSFKKIYKPTNNNLRSSSNTSRANQDNSPRINKGTGYDHQRAVNVAGARESVAQDDQDKTDDLDQERDFAASLIQKLKVKLMKAKNRNKILESSNKELVDKLKGEIEDFKTKNKSLESSNNHFKEANNELSKTNQLMFKDLKKFQAELDKYKDVNYASKVEIDCAKAKGDLMTRQPMAVPVSTIEPKHNVNKSVATSSKKTVVTDSTVKKSRNITRKLYEQVSSRGTDLYSISLQDSTSPNPICLMAKATSSQACLAPAKAYSSDHAHNVQTIVLDHDSLSPVSQSQENVPQDAEQLWLSLDKITYELSDTKAAIAISCNQVQHSRTSTSMTDITIIKEQVKRSYALSWKPCQGDSLNLPDHRAQVDQGSQIKMIQVKEMMQDNDLKNSKSKDKGSKSRSQSMDEQSHYKQDKTITRQSINVKRHTFNVIGGTEEFEEKDLNIGGDC
ncbi:hypothetical protein Tco_0710554 [Tanacetum coccineum]